MRILIYGINYSPELIGIGKYTGEMAEWLAAQGHDIRVVTTPPYYPAWMVFGKYSASRYAREFRNGVKVWRCPLYVPTSPSGLKRLLHLASFAISSLPVIFWQISWHPDFIFVIEPPLFCAPAAWLAARLSGAKAWLHVQDFEVDTAFLLGILPFGWMRQTVSAIEGWLMRRFDCVSSISRSMLKRLVGKGVPQDKVVLFPNWVDIDAVKYNAKKAKNFRKKNGFSAHDFIILYSGNMGKKQGLEIVLEVAEKLRGKKEIHFVLCGDGVAKPDLQAMASKMDLSNVAFLPLQPDENFVGMLSAADLHLITQRSNAADLVLPSKLTNILSVGGLALVATEPDTEMGRLAKEHPGVFLTCSPEDPGELAKEIMAVFRGKGTQRILNSYARDYAKQYLGKDEILENVVVCMGKQTAKGIY